MDLMDSMVPFLVRNRHTVSALLVSGFQVPSRLDWELWPLSRGSSWWGVG